LSIWIKSETLDHINEFRKNTLNEFLGIKVTEIGDDYVKSVMPVDDRTRQPLGLLHGGASVALAESTGSLGSYLAIRPEQRCVGLEVNANHLHSVVDGWVTATAKPIHLGGSTHVWDIRITDDDDRLVCIARLTMAIISPRSPDQ
jgi:1,4-dihydroxy-2-naphthoyl-CoA hydrolase